MRIVFDTNVLLSGLFTRGVCELLLDVCIESPSHVIVLSEHILREFAKHAASKFGAPADQVRQAVEFLRSQADMVAPADVPPDACRDADDLPVLGTALAGKADCIVTGDADLLTLRKYRGVAILSPRSLHERLR